MSHSRWILAICSLLAGVSVGCGDSAPKLYPVSGTVTFDGKPVDGASVMFTPQQGSPGMGTTDASGKYTIATRGQAGAAVGTYSVTVTKQSGGNSGGATAAMPQRGGAEPSEEEKKKIMQQQMEAMEAQTEAMRSGGKAKDLLPHKYSVPEGSGLNATVTTDASKNVFDFALTPE